VGPRHGGRPQVDVPGHAERGAPPRRARRRRHRLRLLGRRAPGPRPHGLRGGQGRRPRLRDQRGRPARPAGRAG
jgi:hypothetical protein